MVHADACMKKYGDMKMLESWSNDKIELFKHK